MQIIAVIVFVLIFGSFAGLLTVLALQRRLGRPLAWKLIALCILTCFGAIIGFGLAIAGVAGYESWESWRSAGWKPTAADVVQSAVATKRKKSKEHYYPSVTYRYIVDGIAYESSRIGFDSTPYCSKAEAQALVDTEFVVGMALVAYVNPSKPTAAILEPGLRGDRLVLTFFGVSFVVGGAWMLRRILLYGPFAGDRRRSLSKRHSHLRGVK